MGGHGAGWLPCHKKPPPRATFTETPPLLTQPQRKVWPPPKLSCWLPIGGTPQWGSGELACLDPSPKRQPLMSFKVLQSGPDTPNKSMSEEWMKDKRQNKNVNDFPESQKTLQIPGSIYFQGVFLPFIFSLPPPTF